MPHHLSLKTIKCNVAPTIQEVPVENLTLSGTFFLESLADLSNGSYHSLTLPH